MATPDDWIVVEQQHIGARLEEVKARLESALRGTEVTEREIVSFEKWLLRLVFEQDGSLSDDERQRFRPQILECFGILTNYISVASYSLRDVLVQLYDGFLIDSQRDFSAEAMHSVIDSVPAPTSAPRRGGSVQISPATKAANDLMEEWLPKLLNHITANNVVASVKLVEHLLVKFRSDRWKDVFIIGDYLCTGLLLGKGGFAYVYLGRHVTTGARVAIKMMDWQRLTHNNAKIKVALEREIAILKSVDHINVTRLHAIEWNGSYVFLVIEFCSGGGMDECLKKMKYLPEADVCRLARQLALGLQHLYNKQIFHRDLKPANLLLHYPPEVAMQASSQFSRATLKITDLGFARTVGPLEMAETLCGSPLYMSPELFAQKPSPKSDLWSVGVILYEMLFGERPFEASNVPALIKLFERQPLVVPTELPSGGAISKECRHLIQSLLRKDPMSRIGWEEFFSHPFLQPPAPVAARVDSSSVVENTGSAETGPTPSARSGALRAALEQAEGRASALQNQLREVGDARENDKNQVQGLKTQMSVLRINCNNFSVRLKERERSLDKAERLVKTAHEREKRAAANVARLEAEVVDRLKHIADLEEAAGVTATERSALQDEATALKGEVANLKEEVVRLTEEAARFGSESERLMEEVARLRSDTERHTQALTVSHFQIEEERKRDSDQFEKERAEARREITRLTELLARQEQERVATEAKHQSDASRATSRIKELDEEVSAQRKSAGEMVLAAAQAAEATKKIEDEAARLSRQKDEAETQHKAEIEQLRSSLQAAQNESAESAKLLQQREDETKKVLAEITDEVERRKSEEQSAKRRELELEEAMMARQAEAEATAVEGALAAQHEAERKKECDDLRRKLNEQEELVQQFQNTLVEQEGTITLLMADAEDSDAKEANDVSNGGGDGNTPIDRRLSTGRVLRSHAKTSTGSPNSSPSNSRNNSSLFLSRQSPTCTCETASQLELALSQLHTEEQRSDEFRSTLKTMLKELDALTHALASPLDIETRKLLGLRRRSQSPPSSPSATTTSTSSSSPVPIHTAPSTRTSGTFGFCLPVGNDDSGSSSSTTTATMKNGSFPLCSSPPSATLATSQLLDGSTQLTRRTDLAHLRHLIGFLLFSRAEAVSAVKGAVKAVRGGEELLESFQVQIEELHKQKEEIEKKYEEVKSDLEVFRKFSDDGNRISRSWFGKKN